MTTWLSDASANRHIKTYVKDFLDLSGNMTVRNTNDYAWNAYGQVLSGPYDSDGGVYFGVGVGMDVSGLTIVVGGHETTVTTTNDGAVTVYRYDTTAEIWYQLGDMVTSGISNSGFGFTVDINDAGTRFMTTAHNSDFVNVYDYNSSTNTWDEQVSITAHGVSILGGRISGDGNTIIFNDYTDNSNTGKLYVYRNTSGTTWTKIGEFTGAHSNSYAGLGPSISYDGNRITLGESNYNYDADGNYSDNNGRVIIYDYSGSGTTWNQVGNALFGHNAKNLFGGATDFSKDGSIVACGSYNGYVEVYQYDASVDGSWNQLGTTIEETTKFGFCVRLSDDGTVLLVNNSGDDTVGTDNGALYIYKYTNGDWVQQGSTLYSQYTGARLGYDHSNAISMSGDGSKIIAGGFVADVNGTNSGYAQAWQWSQKYNTNPALDISGGTMTLWGGAEHVVAHYSVSQLGSTLTGNNEHFGYAVNMNYTGDTMVTTAHAASSNAGEVYVYKYRNNMWGQVGSTVIGSTSGQYLGTPCQISNDGKTIALGSHTATDGGNEGAIYVYEYVNGDWAQKGSTLDGSTSGNNELFGARDTCLSGDGTVVAGYASEGGYAKVFKYVAGSTNDWVQMGSTFTTNSMNVGSTSIGVQSRLTGLSDDGTIFAVSSISDDTTGTNNGKVEVYKFTGEAGSGSWSQLGSTIYGINHSSGESKEGSTISLSADGTILATGSWYYNSSTGIIRVYKYIESVQEWTQMGTHILHTVSGNEWAKGYEMSADGKTLAVGAANEDDGGTNRGAVYIYKYMDGNWVFIKQVNSPYGVDSTYLGKYVTISGDGKRFAAGSNTDPGLVVAWEITNSPALKIEDGNVDIGGNVDISGNVDIGGKLNGTYVSAGSGANSIMLGDNTTASGESGVALGANTNASGIQSMAIGINANASSNYGIAIGQVSVSGPLSVTVGYEANSYHASQSKQVAVGSYATATGQQGIAVGGHANAVGTQSVSMGYACNAYQTRCIAIGLYAVSGNSTSTSSNTCIAIGYGANTATGAYNVAIGPNTTAGNQATALGYACTASGFVSFAAGRSSTASAANSIAIGYAVSASAINTTAIGRAANAYGDYGTAIGSTTKATGQATALGFAANAAGYRSVAIGAYANTSQANAIVLGGSGTSSRVGIGTSSPGSVLHICSRTSGDCQLILESDTDNNTETDNPIILFRQDGGTDRAYVGTYDNHMRISTGSNGHIQFLTDVDSNRLDIGDNGRVGIATTSPGFPLQVNGYVTSSSTYTRRFSDAYNIGGASGLSQTTSIYGQYSVGCGGYIFSNSDRRIKKDIVEINDSLALDKLRLLKPCRYKYRDTLMKGPEEVLGFIAQEVKETIPEAVKIYDGDLPNVMMLGSAASTDSSGTYIITIPNYDTSTLEVDASGNIFTTLEIVIDKNEKDVELNVKILEVLSKTELKVVIDTNDKKLTELPSEIFVYGQYVDNKHAVIKERIFTIGISALQEVDRQLQAEKAKVATLETQMADVLARLAALESV